MQKSAKCVGVDKKDEKEKNKYNIVNPLTDYIADPNERVVDLSTSDINETKAKQQNHVIKIINTNNNNKKTMRDRERRWRRERILQERTLQKIITTKNDEREKEKERQQSRWRRKR